VLGSLLLPGDGTSRSLAAARIGLGALTAGGQPSTMPQSPVAAYIHQALDAHIHLSPQTSLNLVTVLDYASELVDLTFRQGVDPGIKIHPRLLKDLGRQTPANPVDIGEANSNSFVAGQIYSCYACQLLPLLKVWTVV
jgi:hypothetical protein